MRWGSLVVASYTGASQTGVPDAYTASHGTASGGTYSQSLTTVAENSWVIMGAVDGKSGTVNGVGSGTTQRAIDAHSTEELVDSNGSVSPGSKTLNVTGPGATDNWAGVIASFKPAG